ncbi:hypothetical protein [Acidocella sp.]|uniref:hypothetical protein n=1 Tax=Acidocella sp. TaxID=50710 RepID=UPI002626C925|nr:hypothetical protein [Acidocella sp.]
MAGTMIATPAGEVPVETRRAGILFPLPRAPGETHAPMLEMDLPSRQLPPALAARLFALAYAQAA